MRRRLKPAASPAVLIRELLFQIVQGALRLFRIDPPAFDRSLAHFECGRKLFIGQIGTVSSSAVAATSFRSLTATALRRSSVTCSQPEAAPTIMPTVWAISCASVMWFMEFTFHTSNGCWKSEYAEYVE